MLGACYESARRDPRELEASGGTAGNGGGGAAGTPGMGGAGVGGTPSPRDGSSNDITNNDDDGSDAADARSDVTSLDAEGGPGAGADARDAGVDVAGPDPQDVITVTDSMSSDGDALLDDVAVDASGQEAGAGDVIDAGATSQTLPMHGLPLQNPDAGGGPFQSRCASDEVVTGFVGRAGAQTDALGATCTKIAGGVLGTSRNLALNGNTTGGSAVTIACPANSVAVGFVGKFGHCTMWKEDLMVGLGVVCRDLGSGATQTVAITSQPALDSGYTTFEEDCTGGRYLTSFSGQLDSNSLGRCVQQLGGECNAR